MTSRLEYKGTLQLVNMVTSNIINSTAVTGPGAQMDTDPQNPVGCITRYNGNLYRYVKFSTGANAVASVAGAPCYYYPNTTDESMQTDISGNTLMVTSDYASDAYTGVFAGVLLAGGYTTLKYIWILIAGVVEAVVNAGSKGDKIFATADSTFTILAQGTAAFYAIQGVMLEDRSATTTGKAKSLIYPKQVW